MASNNEGIIAPVPNNGNNVTTVSRQSLPADQTNANIPGTINYFGSSFSGTDIKTYVNLYNINGSLKQFKESIKFELSVAKGLVDALNNLRGRINSMATAIAEVSTFAAKQTIFLNNAGIGNTQLNESDVEVKQILLTNFFNNRNFTDPTVVTSINQELNTVLTSKQNQAAQLQQDLSKLESQDTPLAAIELGTLQTVSVQSHREKFAVRALGHNYVKGYTRGPRTIAGSMIFTVFHEHVLRTVMRTLAYVEKDNNEVTMLLSDQLPPLDFTFILANEYGQISEFRLYGLEFLNDSTTYSIEDLLTESVMQFVARDLDPLTSRAKINLDRSMRNRAGPNQENITFSGTQLMLDTSRDYENYLQRLKVRRRILNR